MVKNGSNGEPSSTADDGAADLLGYVTKQTAGFYSFISHAAKAFKETGKLPAEIFLENGKLANKHTAGKPAANKEKRPMSAFNFFMKEKMEQLKADHPDGMNKELFNQAVSAWKELDEAQKKTYTELYKARTTKEPGSEAAELTAPVLPEPKKTPKPKASAAPSATNGSKSEIKEIQQKSQPKPSKPAAEKQQPKETVAVRESQRPKKPKVRYGDEEEKVGDEQEKGKHKSKSKDKQAEAKQADISETKKKRKDADAEASDAKKKKKKKKKTDE